MLAKTGLRICLIAKKNRFEGLLFLPPEVDIYDFLSMKIVLRDWD